MTYTAVRDRSGVNLAALINRLGILAPASGSEDEKELKRVLLAAKERADVYLQNPFTRNGKKLEIPATVEEFVLSYAVRLWETPGNGLKRDSVPEVGKLELGDTDLELLRCYKLGFFF